MGKKIDSSLLFGKERFKDYKGRCLLFPCLIAYKIKIENDKMNKNVK
jgi:hypothetical protein